MRTREDALRGYVKLTDGPARDAAERQALEDPDRLADTLVAHLAVKLDERQELLETIESAPRLERDLQGDADRDRVPPGREEAQEPASRSRWRRTRRSTGSTSRCRRSRRSSATRRAATSSRSSQELAAKKLPTDVQNRGREGAPQAHEMNMMSAEATVVRNYIDWIVALPWIEETDGRDEPLRSRADPRRGPLRAAEDQGADPRVPRASRARRQDAGADPVPRRPAGRRQDEPRAVDRARDRPHVRACRLGGVRDEAEIRGHRRTYIGAMPGKLLHAMNGPRRSTP